MRVFNLWRSAWRDAVNQLANDYTCFQMEIRNPMAPPRAGTTPPNPHRAVRMSLRRKKVHINTTMMQNHII